MNDETPPIPDDPQKSFGSPMENIERMFSTEGRRATWHLRYPNGRDGRTHECASFDAAMEDATRNLDEGKGVHSVARNGNSIHLRAIPVRENQAVAIVRLVAPNDPTETER